MSSLHRRRKGRHGMDESPSAELFRLLKWKDEAMAVLMQWENAWEAAGCPGPLGASKAHNTANEIKRLQRQNKLLRAELNRRHVEGGGHP